MRRSIRAIPFAGSAVWTRRLALLGAILALAAIVLPRRGVDITPALGLLAVGLGLSLLAMPTAAVAAVVIWRTGHKGAGRVVAGLFLSLVTLAYPGYLAAKAMREPPVVDLTTDKTNPPQFASTDTSALAATKAPVVDVSWLLGRGQPAGEADPITFDRDLGTVYRAALKTATSLHWRVVSATAPTARAPLGHIDAVTYSTVMRVPEWIAIRVASRDGQTRIDLRSAADTLLPLAGNDPQRNIQAFADAIEDLDAEN